MCSDYARFRCTTWRRRLPPRRHSLPLLPSQRSPRPCVFFVSSVVHEHSSVCAGGARKTPGRDLDHHWQDSGLLPNSLIITCREPGAGVQSEREASRKSKFFNHLSALSEGIPALGAFRVPAVLLGCNVVRHMQDGLPLSPSLRRTSRRCWTPPSSTRLMESHS